MLQSTGSRRVRHDIVIERRMSLGQGAPGGSETIFSLVSSVTQEWLSLCGPMDCSMPGFPVLHYLSELAQTPVHLVDDAIQPSHPLLPPFPPAFNLSKPQGLFQ